MPKKPPRSFLPPAARAPAGSDSGPFEPLIGIAEAARLLGVSAVTVRRRVNAFKLVRRCISGRLYFRRSEIYAYIEAHRGGFGGDQV